jgi:hypothetical protein
MSQLDSVLGSIYTRRWYREIRLLCSQTEYATIKPFSKKSTRPIELTD